MAKFEPSHTRLPQSLESMLDNLSHQMWKGRGHRWYYDIYAQSYYCRNCGETIPGNLFAEFYVSQNRPDVA